MSNRDISHFLNDESFLNYCFQRNEEDVRRWQQWLTENPDYRSRVEELKNELLLLTHEAAEKETNEQYKALRERIAANEGGPGKKPVFALYRKMAIAATFILVCAAGILLYCTKKDSVQVTARNSEVVTPGSHKAYLTLSDGRKISLTEARNGALAQQNGITITKSKDGQIVYTVPEEGTAGDQAVSGSGGYNQVETPRGGQYEIKLPDGTTVWLNAASSLRYPADLKSGGERRVELSGEGYFAVAKDKSRPFIVKSGRQEVTVLGTEFDVNAYEDDPDISTTLVSGGVMVRESLSGIQRVLKPGQQCSIAKNTGAVTVADINPDDMAAWKKGYFIFDNREIESIMKVISRWYDVDVEYKSINREGRFGGTFSRSAQLPEILKTMEMLGNNHFELSGRKIIISRKNK